MAAAAPLTAAQEAALKAEFGKVFNGVRVKAHTADTLVKHFAGQGDSLTELRDILTMEKDKEDEWRPIWAQIFEEASLSKSDLERFARWSRARGTDVGAAVAHHGHAQSRRAIEVLEINGMTVTREMRADIEAALAQGDAGSEKEQCCCALTVFIIYLGRAPSEEERAWWIEQFNQLGGMEGGQIEITKCPSYAKTHSKTPDSCMTLERALKKESLFADYSVKTIDSLNRAGMYKASAKLMKVLGLAMKQAGGSWARRRAYLVGYFFEEHTGVGLPVDMAYQSALNAMATPVAFEKVTDVMGGSSAGSAVGSLSLSDYTRLDSVSQQGGSIAGSSFDMKEFAGMLKSSITEAVTAGITAIGEGGGGGSGVGGGGGGGGKRKTCMFCKRNDCPMPNGGAPCREANQAANELRLKSKKAREEKEAGDKGE